MAALNFPTSPTVNDLYTENSVTFKWNGTAWIKVTSPFVGTVDTYIYIATASQTIFNGVDSNANTLAFDNNDVVSIYLNGTLLILTTDYTLDAGTNTVTLTSGTQLSDEMQIIVLRSTVSTLDANVTTPADGEVLVYASATSNWVNQSPNVERTYRDTLTFAAEAQKDWAVPANCIRFKAWAYGLSPDNNLSHVIYANMRGLGVAQIFDSTIFTANPGGTSIANSTYVVNMWNGGVGAGDWALEIEVNGPRDASIKTTARGSWRNSGAQPSNQWLRDSVSVQAVAGPSDVLRIECDAGETLTGTIEIEYTVIE